MKFLGYHLVNEISAWNESPLGPYFDSIIFSCEVGHKKPEPEIYRASLEELELEPEDCLYVGDGGSSELSGAKAVGMETVLCTEIIQECYPELIANRRGVADSEVDSLECILSLIR